MKQNYQPASSEREAIDSRRRLFALQRGQLQSKNETLCLLVGHFKVATGTSSWESGTP
jgi:hypothetical protein